MSLGHIRAAALTRLGTLLSGYKELKNPYNIPDNPTQSLDAGYAVRFGTGRLAEGCTRTVPLSSLLVVSLTYALPVRVGDDFAPVVGDLYTVVDSVIASFFNDTFLGIPDKLRGFTSVFVSDAILLENEHVQIDIEFTANHKIDIDYT